jgi:NADPH2 dehydrogenase
MSDLFEKGSLRNLETKNRLVMPPMCMYSADEDGMATDWHRVHYATRAMGGVGLIIVEATAVEKRGRITNRDLGIWDDEQIDGLKAIVDDVQEFGSEIGIQLAHAGRKCGVESERVIAPSAIAYSDRYQTPHEMTHEEIKEVVQAFQDGARRAKMAGFDTIEIHGAHGYLIHEFLSPLSNKREDEYGGSFENRIRLLQEVIQAVKEVWPTELPIIVRLSATDFSEGGITIEDTIQIVNTIKRDVDMINVSTGALVPARIEIYPGYQISYSERIKEECGIPTIAGGLITNYEMIQEILHNNRADYVYVGRELLRNPYFLLQAAAKHQVEGVLPVQYKRGF